MSIFAGTNYHDFLNKKVIDLQKKNKGIKTKLAEYLHITTSYMSQILAGKKDFTIEQAISTVEFFELTKLEGEYFITLVMIARSGTTEAKKYFTEKRNQLKKESLKLSKILPQNKFMTDEERAVFYSSKIYSSVHLYTSIGDGKTSEEIVKRFALKKSQANKVISFLLTAGLISEKNGKYCMEGKTTHLEKDSPFLINHLTNWRLTAIEKIEKITDEEMMYSGNFSLSKSDFLVIREELVASLQRVIHTVKESPTEELANLNIDFFWM